MKRDQFKLERIIDDRILTLFVCTREDGPWANIDLQRGMDTVFSFAVPIGLVDTFAKAAAYFAPIEAMMSSQPGEEQAA